MDDEETPDLTKTLDVHLTPVVLHVCKIILPYVFLAFFLLAACIIVAMYLIVTMRFKNVTFSV